MMARDAVLVVGGTGAFGSRLVDGILATTEHRVVIGGRDVGRAQAAATRCNAAWPGQRVTAMGIDTARPDGAALTSCGAGVAIDAAGPFDATRHGFAAAVLAAGMDYIDLADSRRFVAGFAAALDGAARAGGRVALTGASSTPALSTAALDALTAGWRRVEEVVVAIAPGNRAPRGTGDARNRAPLGLAG